MSFINKLKKVAKEVNVFTLVGAMVLSVMLMSFKEEEKKVDKSVTTVTYGVTDEDGTKLYITQNPVTEDEQDCGVGPIHCKATLPADEAEDIIQIEEGTGRRYVELNDVDAFGQGPYSGS